MNQNHCHSLPDPSPRAPAAIRRQLVPRMRFVEKKALQQKENQNIPARNELDLKAPLSSRVHRGPKQTVAASSEAAATTLTSPREEGFAGLDPRVRDLFNFGGENFSFSKIQQQLNNRPPYLRFKQSKRKILSTAKLPRELHDDQLFSLHIYQNALPLLHEDQSFEDSASPYVLQPASSLEVFQVLKEKIPSLPSEVRHKWERNTFTTVSIATFGRKRFKMRKLDSSYSPSKKSSTSAGFHRTRSDNNIALKKERRHSQKPTHRAPAAAVSTNSLLADQEAPVALKAEPLPPSSQEASYSSPRVRSSHSRVKSAIAGNTILRTMPTQKSQMFPEIVSRSPTKSTAADKSSKVRSGRLLEHQIKRLLAGKQQPGLDSDLSLTSPALFQRYVRQAQRA